MQKIILDRDDIAVEFDEIVVVLQVDGHLPDLSAEASKSSDETERGEDKELPWTHQHKGGQEQVCREEQEDGKEILQRAVFDPAETQCLREDDMLQVAHIARREQKELLVEFEEMVFLFAGGFSSGKQIEHLLHLRGLVYPGDKVEGTCRVEDKRRDAFHVVKLLERTPDTPVPTGDDHIVILLDIMLLCDLRDIDGGDIQSVVRNLFAYREYLHQ